MANLQRMLGAMLASRMGGRGGMGGALGSAALMGGRGRGGRRGGGLGGKAGLAALGYLAYRTYQNNKQNRERDVRPGETPQGGGGMLGGLLDSITGGGQTGTTAGSGASLSERIGNVLNPRQDQPAPQDEPVPDSPVSDDKALLLIRAMIAAAYSDGELSPEERARIIAKLDEAGADADDHRVIEKELQDPRPLDELLRAVQDPETAQQFYLASRAAVEGTNEVQKSYLSYLRQRLNLPESAVAEAEQFAS